MFFVQFFYDNFRLCVTLVTYLFQFFQRQGTIAWRTCFGQKYIACGDKMFFGGFWPISSNILMLYGQVLLYEHYFLFINEKMNLKFRHQNF